VDRSAAEEWIRSYVTPAGPIELEKDQPWSTVLRVPIAGDTVWFKRCKSIWTFEPRLTANLHERWPDRTPEVIAHDDDRAWLLLRDAGTQVEHLPDAQAVWLDALRRYAELQRGEVAHAAEHLAHGVPDQRLPALPAEYAAMLERDIPLTTDQRGRLRRFEPRFAELCAALAARGVPETIQHDDLHIHNVYARNGRTLLLDWGDSCIAHPYFSLVVTFMFVDDSEHLELRDAFLEAWDGDVETFDLALRIGRIAHVFKWIRFRDVLPADFLPEYDGWFVDWLAQAAAQADE
jgi:hypothetical protein